MGFIPVGLKPNRKMAPLVLICSKMWKSVSIC